MPSPSTTLATLRPELASSMEEFNLEMSRRGFIGLLVAPSIEVQKPSGDFGKIPVEQLLQTHDTLRASGSGYPRGRFTFTKASFACQENGWEEPIDDREAEMYAEYLDAELVGTARARDFVLRNHEIRIANMIFNASTWTGAGLTTAVVNEWDDAANATPNEDIKAAKAVIRAATGLEPNALILNINVFENLINCDAIIDRLKYAGFTDPRPGSITAQALALALNVDRIIVAGQGGSAIKATNNQGQSIVTAQIWSNEYAMLARVATSLDPREACVARTFHWGADGSSIGGTVESYRDETIRGNVIRVRHDTDEIVMYTEAAHLLSNITT